MLKPRQNGNPSIRHIEIAVSFCKFLACFLCQLAWSFISGIPSIH
jgi:hypothetical protein